MWYLFLVLSALGSYLPGANPTAYHQGDPLTLSVSSIVSSTSPEALHYFTLNFCTTNSTSATADRHTISSYSISMQVPSFCSPLCTVENSPDQQQNFSRLIENDYRSTWYLDTLPSGYRVALQDTSTSLNLYRYGVPIGFTYKTGQYVYNHHHFIVQTYDNLDGTWSVVGFLVQPLSFRGAKVCTRYDWREIIQVLSIYEQEIITLDPSLRIVQEEDTYSTAQEVSEVIEFTYSVSFEPSGVKWVSRWDMYLYSRHSNVHWLAILNSFFVVVVFSGVVAYLLRKSVGNEIYSSHEKKDPGECNGETGWKQMRGEFFKPPRMPEIFSIVVGTGFQLIFMAVGTLVAICMGFFEPDDRENLLNILHFFFASMSCLGGCTSVRIYKTLGGINWKAVCLGTALIFPGGLFLLLFIINTVIIQEDSPGAVDFTSLLELLCIWFGISLPLIFITGFIVYRRSDIHNPCSVSKISKPLHSKSTWWLYVAGIMAGSLPFGCMALELTFILKSMWHSDMLLYLFAFLFLSFLALIITSAEVSVLMTYFLLCREDNNWWWFSFLVSGSSGVYLFVYSAIYYEYYLEVSRLSSIAVYFAYILIISTGYALITGTIGFFSCMLFIRSIFTQVKKD